MGVQAKQQLLPGVIRVRRTHHHLQVRVNFPEFFNGLCAVPALGHTHVDKGQGIGPLLGHGDLKQLQPLLPAVGRVQFEHGALRYVGGAE